MKIRKYKTTDLEEITELFYNTVHTINLRDYTKEQVNVWATGKIDSDRWNNSLMTNYSIVAVEEEKIVGFGDIDETNYLDCLFVHKNFQRKGIATALCDELEKQANEDSIVVHASLTAKPFFEQRGYLVVREQFVERDSVFLKNYVMEKRI